MFTSFIIPLIVFFLEFVEEGNETQKELILLKAHVTFLKPS